eukprot:532170_1
MGNCLGSSQATRRVVFVGLDNAGKSSVVQCLTDGRASQNQRPTIGYQQANITRNKNELYLMDVGGDAKGRDLWRHYVKNAHAIVFVIDASDEYHLDQCGDESAKKELHAVLKNDELPWNAPLLIFANKQDKVGALNKSELEKRLDLSTIKTRPWHIETSCALNGNGIEEGIDWLCQALNRQMKEKKK